MYIHVCTCMYVHVQGEERIDVVPSFLARQGELAHPVLTTYSLAQSATSYRIVCEIKACTLSYGTLAYLFVEVLGEFRGGGVVAPTTTNETSTTNNLFTSGLFVACSLTPDQRHYGSKAHAFRGIHTATEAAHTTENRVLITRCRVSIEVTSL